MTYLDGKLRHKAWWRRWRGLPDPPPITISDITREAMRILDKQLAAWVDKDYL